MAQSRVYDTIYLSRSLDLPRGLLAPAAPGANYLRPDQNCEYLRAEWGWNQTMCEDVDVVLFDFLPSVQTLLVYSPNSDGRVAFDDWRQEDREAEIDQLWRETKNGLRERSDEIGKSVTPKRWRVYPTLSERPASLYYALELNRDGDDALFLRATRFDRRGYVSFMLVPDRPDYSDDELRGMIERVLAAYRPHRQEGYYDAVQGDAVAVVGSIGVLAGLLGVQHAESVMAVAIADAMKRAKEFWYLSFLSIALFARKIFRRAAAAVQRA